LKKYQLTCKSCQLVFTVSRQAEYESRKKGFYICRPCCDLSRVKSYSNHPAKASYETMRRKCLSKTHDDFYKFGEIGITICTEWLERENFFKWCDSQNYVKGSRIIRKNKSLGFNPDNCYVKNPSNN